MGLFSGKYNPLRIVKEDVYDNTVGVPIRGTGHGLSSALSAVGDRIGIDLRLSPIQGAGRNSLDSQSPVAPTSTTDQSKDFAQQFLPEDASSANDIPFPDINTPGLNIDVTDGNVNITRTQETIDAMDFTGIDNAIADIDGLLAQVTPGSGRLTTAIQESIDRAKEENSVNKRRHVGNLQDNFARRRLSGSSFAADAISRAEAEFAEVDAKIEADGGLALANAFLQELGISSQLIGQKSGLDLQKNMAILNQLNFETGTGVQVTQMLNQVNTANAELDQQLNLTIAQINASRANVLEQIASNERIAKAQADAARESSIFSGLGNLFGLGMGYVLSGGNPFATMAGGQVGSNIFGNIFASNKPMPSGSLNSMTNEGFFAAPGMLRTSPQNTNFLARPGSVYPQENWTFE